MKLKYIATYISILFCSIGFAQTTVYTCKGGTVSALTFSEFSQAQIQYYNSQTQSQFGYLGITIIGDASQQYNCHSYAWHLREGNTYKVWINNASTDMGACFDNTHNIDKYWTDGCFIQVCNESEADKVHYHCGDHSAVRSTTHAGYWESKWGALSVVRHTRTGVPYDQPNTVNYYASTKISQVGSTYVCGGGTGSFAVKSISGATYSWTWSSNLSGVSGSTTNQVTIQATGTGLAWVEVTITTPCSGISATRRHEFVIGAPYATIDYYQSGGCNGTWRTWFLGADASKGSNWYWYAPTNPSNFNIHSPYSASTYVGVTGGGAVKVNYTDLCGLPRTDGVTIWSGCYGYRVSPNPARSTIKVSVEGSDASARDAGFHAVKIYDQEGNIKKYLKFNRTRSASINVSDLPMGIYVIEIINDHGSERQKVQVLK
ncbi:MAG TPA: T9SS type A sorting domain-containing protein [Chitinophagaceae bacterium]|nr:T9SS type A sorting domain-containing protein [Chitinophagaceae bacterium]